jgi:hypothetical protein
VVEPVDPLEGGPLDGLERAPGPAASDHFGLEQPDDGLGEGVVEAVTDAADRWLEAGFSETLSVLDRDVLDAAVAGMDETALDGMAGVPGLLEGVKDA